MDIQEIIAFVALGIALVFLSKKFFFKKKKSAKDCGSGDCGCLQRGEGIGIVRVVAGARPTKIV